MAMPNAVDLRGRRDPCETNTISAPSRWWDDVNARRGSIPRASYVRASVSNMHAVIDLAAAGDADAAAVLAKITSDVGDGE